MTPALIRPRRLGVQASLVVTLASSGCGNDDDDGGNVSTDSTLPPMPGPGSDEATMSGPTTDDTASTTGVETTGESVTDPTIAPMPNPTETDDATLDGTGSSTTNGGSDDGTSSSSGDGDDESTTAIPPMPPPMMDPIDPIDPYDDEAW